MLSTFIDAINILLKQLHDTLDCFECVLELSIPSLPYMLVIIIKWFIQLGKGEIKRMNTKWHDAWFEGDT